MHIITQHVLSLLNDLFAAETFGAEVKGKVKQPVKAGQSKVECKEEVQEALKKQWDKG